MTPLVSVTHYLSHTPRLHYESDLIAVMNLCCTGKSKICAPKSLLFYDQTQYTQR